MFGTRERLFEGVRLLHELNNNLGRSDSSPPWNVKLVFFNQCFIQFSNKHTLNIFSEQRCEHKFPRSLVYDKKGDDLVKRNFCRRHTHMKNHTQTIAVTKVRDNVWPANKFNRGPSASACTHWCKQNLIIPRINSQRNASAIRVVVIYKYNLSETLKSDARQLLGNCHN